MKSDGDPGSKVASPAVLAALILTALPYGARAHLPHDVTTEVAVASDGDSTLLVAQYHYPPRPLLVISEDGGRSWSFVAPEGLGQVLTSLHFASGDVLYAADGVGTAPLRSEDGGWTWKETSSPDGTVVRCAVPAAVAGETSRLFAGTNTGLAVSEDGGETWDLGVGPGVGPLADVAPAPEHPDDPFVAALSMSGALWCSDAVLDSWSACGPEEGAAAVHAVSLSPGFADDDQIWAGGDGGAVWLSRDRGTSWEQLVPSGDWGSMGQPVQDLVSPDTDAVVAVGGELAAPCTWDAGASWEMCDQGIPAPGAQASDEWGHYRRITRPGIGADGPLALAAWEGVLTGDGDGSWTEGCYLQPDYVRAVSFHPDYPEDPRIWLGTYGGGLMVTADGGQRWSPVGEGAGGKFIQGMTLAPEFPDDPVMLLIANRQLLRSDDAGETFSLVDTPGLHHVLQIALPAGFAESGIGFAVGTTEVSRLWAVSRTEDGGESWALAWEADSPDEPQVTAITPSPTFDTDGTLFGLQSGPGAVVRSTDLGESWEPTFEPPGSPRFAALFALDGESGSVDLRAITAAGELWAGIDGLPDWTSLGFPGGSILSGVQVPGEGGGASVLYLSEDPTGLLRSADRGASWERVPCPFRTPVLTVAVPPEGGGDTTLIATTHKGSFFTCDGGESWSLLDRILRLEEDACPVGYGGDGWNKIAAGWDWIEMRSSQADASVEVEFWGRAVRWLGSAGPDAGTASVYVDGEFVGVVDLSELPPADSRVLYEHVFDDDGHHTLRIEVVGDGWVAVDAFEVERHTLHLAPGLTLEVGEWCVDLDPPAEEPPAAGPSGCCGGACDQATQASPGLAGPVTLSCALLWRRRLRPG